MRQRYHLPRTLRLGLVLTLTLASSGSGSNVESRFGTGVWLDGGCRSLIWSSPSPLTSRGSVAPLEMLSIHEARDGDLLALGLEVRDWASRLPKGAGVLLGPGGSPLPRPGADPWLAYPRAQFDPQGKLHLVWGEPDSTYLGAEQWAMMPIRRLLHAYYRPDLGWSEPERVIEREILGWGPVRGALRMGRRGAVRLLVPLPPDSIAYLTWSGAIWSEESVPADGALYADWVTTEDGSEFMAYVGFGRSTEPLPSSAGNSVFITRRSDDQDVWGRSRQVQLSLEGAAVDIRLLEVESNLLATLWGQARGSGRFPDFIRLVVSRDGGVSWSSPHDLPAPYGSRYAAVADESGAIHVVWIAAGAGDSYNRRLKYACWYDGIWSQPQTLFDERTGSGLSPALIVRSDSSLVLAWSQVDDPQDPVNSSTILTAEGSYAPR